MLQLLEKLLNPKCNGSMIALVLAHELGREFALLVWLQLHQTRRFPVSAHLAETTQPGWARGRDREHVVGANEGVDRRQRRPRSLLVAVLVQPVYQQYQSFVGQRPDEGVLQLVGRNERSERLPYNIRHTHLMSFLCCETAPECEWDEQGYACTKAAMDCREQFRGAHQVKRKTSQNCALA